MSAISGASSNNKSTTSNSSSTKRSDNKKRLEVLNKAANSFETDHVIVAIRVRPFNHREQKREAQSIVAVSDDGRSLTVRHPEEIGNVKKFSFDRVYWSHDGYTETSGGLLVADPHHVNGKMYVDQARLYQSLAQPLLNAAWQGYNISLFAYGQTSSGKSYTMVGYGTNRGLVPRLCEDLFNTVTNRAGLAMSIEVSLSMLELYAEVVRDLLDVELVQSQPGRKKGLKIREHPTKGFFAEGLKSFLVTSYPEMFEKIEQGATNRSISATAMNETSSRSHMIILINIKQRYLNSAGSEETKTSTINLVDLAGSERLSDLAAGGSRSSVSNDRFKESVAINQSLSCLGNCIHALAEKAAGGRNIKVPYRESVLTRLLMNALGGNSKTAMITNISPADINYDETISSLRYATRAKQIQNFAKINHSPTDRLIGELREENDKLRKLLDRDNFASLTASLPMGETGSVVRLEEEIEAIVTENERKMTELRESYETRLENAKSAGRNLEALESERRALERDKANVPHLSNLNFDEQLVGKIIFLLRPGVNLIGKGEDCHIRLMGPLVQEHHAVINRTEVGKVILERCDEECRILLNGDVVTHKVNLSPNDRLLFGTSQLFVFKNPLVLESTETEEQATIVTFELAQEEIAFKQAGYSLMDNEDHSMEQALLNRQLLELIPAVEEVNAIASELEKLVSFELVLVAPIFLGRVGRKPEPYIRVLNSNTGQEFQWPAQKFLDRLYLMREMYHNYETGEEEWDLPFENDPFQEDPSAECLIGTAQLYLQPLAYMVEVHEQLSVADHAGREVGIINVEVAPCEAASGEIFADQEDVYVDSPQEMLGKPVAFLVRIAGARGLPSKFTDIYVKFCFFVDETSSTTEHVATSVNPNFNFRRVFAYEHATQELIDYLKEGLLNIEVYGRQLLKSGYQQPLPTITAIGSGPGGTKEQLQEELAKYGQELMGGFKMNGRVIDPNRQSIIVELLLMKKQQARMHQRIDNIKKLIDISEKQRLRYVSVDILKELVFTTTAESADAILSHMLNDENYVPAVKDMSSSATCLLL